MCVAAAPAAAAAGGSTTLGSILGSVSLGAGILGTGISAYSAYQQGQAQNAAAKYQAEVAEANSETARQQAEIEEGKNRRAVAQKLGTQRATFAANGVDISDADTSANYILGDTAEWGDYDSKIINYNGQVASNNYANQASYYSSSSNSNTGLLSATGSLLSGASSVASNWYKYSQTT